GRSSLGLDCSGLVTNVWTRTGEKPSRDAWQQALAGELVATSWHRAGIQAGDQVFFINESGKIYHTGVALDADHILHAAPPCVQIGSLDPQDRLHDKRLDLDFFMAKRP
ncbi:MAG: C40 family peptidase, partial [Planctomycetes bacterium]|nr:C40 family peptidase [Planctomycetota bacterium]